MALTLLWWLATHKWKEALPDKPTVAKKVN
jgi:hypothetical protein